MQKVSFVVFFIVTMAIGQGNREYRLPSGPEGPGKFGAHYTRLKYAPEWEKPWRVGQYADVVVRFDNSGHRFVFWRGTSYIPCWVTDTEVWYTNEFVERRGWLGGGDSMMEPMSDKQARYSHARIIESNDARVVIHWRYSPVDLNYKLAYIDSVSGWGDWVDEYYTIYPDAVGVRYIKVFSSSPHEDWIEFQECIMINQPGTMPEDNIELGAITLVNIEGESKTYYWTEDGGPDFGEPKNASILRVNLKAQFKPFAIVAPPDKDGMLITSYKGHAPSSNFNFWNHWPVSQLKSDGTVATSAEKPSHSSLAHIGLPGRATTTWDYYSQSEKLRTKVMLNGLTDRSSDELVMLAKSWLYAPELKLTSSNYLSSGYDQTEGAYVITNQKQGEPGLLSFTLSGSEKQPLVNPAIIIKNWGDSKATLKIDKKTVKPGRDFRFGHRFTLDSDDLIIWMRKESTIPVRLSIIPVK